MRTRPPFRSAMFLALLSPAVACAQSPAGPDATARTGGAAGQSLEQFEARSAERLMALDTDGDGRISRAEFMGGQRSGKGDPDRRFARLDANGDGQIDRSEIDAMLQRRFTRMDRDHDGRVTSAERAAVRQPPARPGRDDPDGQAR